MPKIVVDIKLESAPIITSKSVIMKFLPSQDTTSLLNVKSQHSENEARQPQSGSLKTNAVVIKRTDSISTRVISNQNINSKNLQTLPSQIKNEIDTSSIRVFEYDGYSINGVSKGSDQVSSNFLLAIPHKNISNHYKELLFNNSSKTDTVKKQTIVTSQTAVIQKESGFNGNLKPEVSLNWLPAILLLSLFIFSWIKLVYQKYVVQVVASIVNYQVSIRLLREKNVLFRNMAIGLNFVFAVNLGLLIFYYLQFNNLNQIYSSNLLSVIIYSLGLIVAYNFKTFLCKMIGNVFMVKEQFSEYVHNIHLYNKNLGLFLFPIVIIFPYIADNHVKAFVLYLGLIIFIVIFLLLIYRGIQIIMRNGVSIFYLILYLCAIEILPILLLIKYSYTLV